MIVGCLALNASFEPLTMVPMRRALRLVIDGKAEIVEADADRTVRSERLSLPRPAVIRLTKFVHVPRKFRRQVTNTFLFARDGYRCQYCGRSVMELGPRESLTRDHLIPMSRGGTNDWTNVVTACSPCNTRKANRLPEEIGMHPLHNPVEPHFVHLSWAVRRLTPTQAKYIRVFYGENTLHQLENLGHRGHHLRPDIPVAASDDIIGPPVLPTQTQNHGHGHPHHAPGHHLHGPGAPGKHHK